jgi:UDP-N-acetylglucosamine 4-epimerase
VDFVLHHAAVGSVSQSIADPVDTHATNATGFVNMLVAAREGRVKRFIYASSSAVYGDLSRSPQKEDETGNCLSPYAATKHANELYADAFARCYGLQTIGLRYFNVFGPRQDPNGAYAAVIPKWISAMMNSGVVIINGDGETTRDFCYVANVARANLLAALVEAPGAVNQIYNVGTQTRTSLNQLFALLREKLITHHPSLADLAPVHGGFREGDIRHSEADISKARRILGYVPSHYVEKGISEALDWYRHHLRRRAGARKTGSPGGETRERVPVSVPSVS